MIVTQKRIYAEARDLAIFFLISALHTFLVCRRCTTEYFVYIFLMTFLMWVLLWKGNTFLSEYLSAKISWIDRPARRFFAGIVVNIGYTVLAVVLLIRVFESFSPVTLGKGNLYTIYGSIIITILISIFLHARAFLSYWRKAAFEKEKFEKESIAARYETLKNQVSPHFLFNSLNALTNLVYEDPDRAAKFIKQLSEVYRYVLDTRDKEVVSISDEIKFLDSYLYLQRIRYGEKLQVSVDPMDNDIKLPPLVLQMLIENAIKHNVISEEDPLKIRISCAPDSLVVENNLQERNRWDDEAPSGIGLENITRRYKFLSDKKVAIVKSDRSFIVKLPLLREIR